MAQISLMYRRNYLEYEDRKMDSKFVGNVIRSVV